MCDTVVVRSAASADGRTIFGKNSDREPNEAHHVVRIPSTVHALGECVKCTYIEIPQVETTYEVLLAKPFWIWGAEMGANEHGVVIGNEAVFTKVSHEKQKGLIGMDLLRLALERARTAREALDVITTLLAEYGQSGNCGFQHRLRYHNSFIIADPDTAWVLETAGRQWAAQQVDTIRTISNAITIGAEWDLASDDLVSYAADQGWCKGRVDFHFARCYSDSLYTRFSASHARQHCTTDILLSQQGRITPVDVMRVLRSHGSPDYHPAFGLFGAQVCMHAGAGPIRGSQTVGSMVSVLDPDTQTHYVTGTAAPCTGIFKPIWTDIAYDEPAPTGTYDETMQFWQHEVLHRLTLKNYASNIKLYQPDRDELEQRFIAGAELQTGGPVSQRAAYSARCFAEAATHEEEWITRLRKTNNSTHQGPLYRRAWRGFNRTSGMASILC